MLVELRLVCVALCCDVCHVLLGAKSAFQINGHTDPFSRKTNSVMEPSHLETQAVCSNAVHERDMFEHVAKTCCQQETTFPRRRGFAFDVHGRVIATPLQLGLHFFTYWVLAPIRRTVRWSVVLAGFVFFFFFAYSLQSLCSFAACRRRFKNLV